MRLWLKQTLLALAMILISVSACLYFFTAIQTESLLHQAEESGVQNLTAFCEHLSTLDRTGTVDRRTDSTTRTALGCVSKLIKRKKSEKKCRGKEAAVEANQQR